jgi:hypothetical protein
MIFSKVSNRAGGRKSTVPSLVSQGLGDAAASTPSSGTNDHLHGLNMKAVEELCLVPGLKIRERAFRMYDVPISVYNE